MQVYEADLHDVDQILYALGQLPCLQILYLDIFHNVREVFCSVLKSLEAHFSQYFSYLERLNLGDGDYEPSLRIFQCMGRIKNKAKLDLKIVLKNRPF